MTALVQQVRRTIRRHDLLPGGSRVLVGVSGGSDSVALSLLLVHLAGPGGFGVAGLAHVNHLLRDTAGRDEQFCRDLAGRLAVPFFGERVDVRRFGEQHGLSIETAARRLRYEALARSAEAAGADRIAVGHTQDDQAETFLLKLIRGAGLTGLAGIYPRRDRIVRPLLDVSRAALRRFLVSRGEAWVEDETNADVANPRNRVRHLVLPELDRAYGGSIRGAIARAADLAREDGQWLEAEAERRFRTLSAVTTTGLELDAVSLAAEPAALQRRILRRAIVAVAGGREIDLVHVQAAQAVLTGESGGADLPGCRMEPRRGKLVLIQQDTLPK